ncbi:MAG: replication and repair protein RecF [Pseudonocardiales bacterium]|nr:replication and repair protein RecF [Pseudonocardiales bacterium]
MYVRHLSLADFRNWPAVDVTFAPGVSVLVGANGQGKTNLVEAIGYAATLTSHRVSTDAPLVREGTDRAVIRVAVVAGGRELRVELEVAPGQGTRARLNGAPVPRPRELLGAVRAVVFAPEDLTIVRGDPAERRRFLDGVLTARSPRMAGVRADYERVLKQRGALLKSAGAARRAGRSVELRTLEVWDEQLAEHGGQLLAARLDALARLRGHAAAAYAQVASTGPDLRMAYRSTVALADGSDTAAQAPELGELPTPHTAEQLGAALLAELAGVRPAELDRGVNLVGPHRDDVHLALGSLPVRGYASHGESWSVALALRLGSFELLRADDMSDAGEPVLVLDDVFAELDTQRRDQLAKVAAGAEQAIITAAVDDDVPGIVAGARYLVQDGVVSRADALG